MMINTMMFSPATTAAAVLPGVTNRPQLTLSNGENREENEKDLPFG